MDRKELIEQTRATYWNVRDDLKDKTLPELQDICRDAILPFAVCALNVTGDLNLGIMMRTAALMGAEKFIIYGRHNYDSRTTVGAQNYIEVVKAGSINHNGEIDYSQFIPLMANHQYSPVFFDTGGIPLPELDMTKYTGMRKHFGYIPCLIFGNEGLGIPKELTDSVGTLVTIPQRGVLRSLNVSAAASIAIHHFSSFLSNNDSFI